MRTLTYSSLTISKQPIHESQFHVTRSPQVFKWKMMKSDATTNNIKRDRVVCHPLTGEIWRVHNIHERVIRLWTRWFNPRIHSKPTHHVLLLLDLLLWNMSKLDKLGLDGNSLHFSIRSIIPDFSLRYYLSWGS